MPPLTSVTLVSRSLPLRLNLNKGEKAPDIPFAECTATVQTLKLLMINQQKTRHGPVLSLLTLAALVDALLV